VPDGQRLRRTGGSSAWHNGHIPLFLDAFGYPILYYRANRNVDAPFTTGTPSGVGLATGDYLQPGARIECTIENLGTLTNTLGNRPKQFYEPLGN